jgi:hypothetical protein
MGAASGVIPPLAKVYLPALVSVLAQIWPGAPMPSFVAGQVETESCVSLSSARCWNPRAELKTSRELGIGLGQTTIAYNADGSVRFDNFAALRRQYAALNGWTWDKRFDARYQLTALVEMDHTLYLNVSGAASETDRVVFALVGYNGGAGGLQSDRMLCRNTPNCDPSRWFGNVEKTSFKSRAIMRGYGRSPFQISRDYPKSVLSARVKYEPYF